MPKNMFLTCARADCGADLVQTDTGWVCPHKRFALDRHTRYIKGQLPQKAQGRVVVNGRSHTATLTRKGG